MIILIKSRVLSKFYQKFIKKRKDIDFFDIIEQQKRRIYMEKKLRLKEARKKIGLTQKEVADYIGISQNNYSYWENGKVKIDNISIQRLSELFKVTTDYLLGKIENEIDLNELNLYQIPLIGKVVAGKPIESQENLEGYVYINYKPAEEYFALRVWGDSMINAGIREKTILICHKQTYADNGDIVVALLNGEQTVKYYKTDEKGNKFLVPANNNYLPIQITREDEILILGKVIETRFKF